MRLDRYSYELPDSLIAQEPAIPRDSSKLLIYNTKTNMISVDTFVHVDRYLAQNSFLVLNKTKVVPSRVVLKKATGGKVTVFFLLNDAREMMVDRRVKVGERLFFNTKDFVTVVRQNGKLFEVRYDFDRVKLLRLLDKAGVMPIPPYIKHSPLTKQSLRKKYQTIFAQTPGSVAAPTASLHFTRRVLGKLEQQNIPVCFITLHVGLGTFAPVTDENLMSKTLHAEYFEIDDETVKSINRLKKDRKLVAVGTTVVRTLESIARSSFLNKTDLFIFPPYDFKMVDGLITNFHLPRSSLMMLVDAFLQFKRAKKSILDLYRFAVGRDFRFYSFGDAMLIL